MRIICFLINGSFKQSFYNIYIIIPLSVTNSPATKTQKMRRFDRRDVIKEGVDSKFDICAFIKKIGEEIISDRITQRERRALETVVERSLGRETHRQTRTTLTDIEEKPS